MCCFSKPVISVSTTNIFARSAPNGRQYVVYSMTLNASEDLAMILLLPVKKDAGEKAVEFINLKEYPNFFADMRKGFPVPQPAAVTKSISEQTTFTASAILEVVKVGDFEASFVPTVKDFSRLDERFRLPPGAWEKLPQYQSYGFAVFKLKSAADPRQIHPMAFTFPRRDEKKLFFPTVHIHDGKVHAKADFDHALFAQPLARESWNFQGWEESHGWAIDFMEIKKTQGIVSHEGHCYKRELHGDLPNKDTWVEPMS